MRSVMAAAATMIVAASASAGFAARRIVPDTAPGLSLGTTVSQAGQIYTINGGTLVGANLFHSFSSFSLAAGQTAGWIYSAGNPLAVQNVINRVTGGAPSQINGTIDTTALPNASFFFINPAGIVFGAGASVNVPGAAYFSTASVLRFADGASFSAATPSGSVLTVAAPIAFGFLGGEGDLSVTGVSSNLFPGPGKLSLSAADVQISNSTFSAGAFDLFAVGDQAIDLPVSGVPSSGSALEGNLSISGNAALLTAPTASSTGAIQIAGGTVVLTGGTVATFASTTAPGGNLAIAAQSVSLTAGALLVTFTGAGQDAGDVSVNAGSLLIDGAGAVLGQTGIFSNTSGSGDGGVVNLDIAGTLAVQDGGEIVSQTNGSRNAGVININSGTLTVQNLASINSNTFGAGNAGNLNITSGTVLVDNGTISANSATSADGFVGTGNAGRVTLNVTGGVMIQNTGSISSDADDDTGAAGNVSINAGSLLVNGAGAVLAQTGISSNTHGSGGGGAINIDIAGDTVIENGGEIGSQTKGSGNGGVITINSGTLTVQNLGFINSFTFSTGNAGDINITSGSVIVDNGSITASSATSADGFVGTGNAGRVTLNVTGGVMIQNTGSISSDADDDTGAAGNVSINAGSLLINGAGAVLAQTGISSNTHGSGGGGAINIDIAGDTVIENGGEIGSQTKGSGNGGVITIDSGSLTVQNLGFVNSFTFSTGNAGDISVISGSVILDNGSITASSATSTDGFVGTGNAGQVSINVTGGLTIQNGGLISSDAQDGLGSGGNVSISSGNLSISGLDYQASSIETDTYGAGSAGRVTVNVAGLLTVGDYGKIASDTFGSGNAGSVSVQAAQISIIGESSSITSSASGITFGDVCAYCGTFGNTAIGNAGDINVTATGVLTLGGVSSFIESVAGLGLSTGGTIRVTAGNLVIENGGTISTTSPFGFGVAGQIYINSPAIDLNGGYINSNALYGDAGSISIVSKQISLNETTINSQSSYNLGGSVYINSNQIILNEYSQISTNSTSGAAGDIVLTLNQGGLLTLEGGSSLTTTSGADSGGQITIATPTSIIMNGGLIQALGPGNAALIHIDAGSIIQSSDQVNTIAVAGVFNLDSQVVDVSASVALPKINFIDASSVLSGPCASRRAEGQTSALGTRATGPYGAEGPTLNTKLADDDDPRACHRLGS